MARVLVVDDEPHLRLILQKQLESEGYEVTTAEDGFSAIAALRRDPPDLVLLDVMMPGMGGVDVIRWMKKNYRTSSVPVIFLTARTDQHEKVAGLLEGANDYLTKPYEKDELIARIHNTLEFSQLQRQASPLTGLPGNQAIQHEVVRRIARKQPFAFLYIDLDNFKGYNDYYGYQRGDSVICRTSALLCDVLDSLYEGEGFVGHVGGDDFVLLIESYSGREVADAIVERFDAMIRELYDPEDREKGYIEVGSRDGEAQRSPLITVTIAVARDAGGQYHHVGSLGAAISELKRFGKQQTGSVVVTDRRTGETTTRDRVG